MGGFHCTVAKHAHVPPHPHPAPNFISLPGSMRKCETTQRPKNSLPGKGLEARVNRSRRGNKGAV